MQTQILGLVTPLTVLCFAATFVMLWRAGGLQRHVLGYALGYFLSAIGFLATHLLPTDAFYTFHITQLFYSLGATVMIASMCERAGLRLHLGSMAFVYGVSAVTLAIAVNMTNEAGPLLVIVNMGYGVMFAMGATTLLTSRRRGAIDIAILAVVAFHAADFLIRPTMTLLFEGAIPAAVYRESIYYSLIGLVLGVKGVSMAVVLIGASIGEWTQSLRESGERDALTGLQNRGAFEQAMRQMLPRAQVEGRKISLVVADIDHFKQVNDIWGHQAGDRALSAFAVLIQQMVRSCDSAGRVGGEEFCIAVWDCDNGPAEHLAERIRQAFSQLEHESLGENMRLTASFGIATAREGETYGHLFGRADAALYEAKSGGRNLVSNAEEKRESATPPVLASTTAQLKRA